MKQTKIILALIAVLNMTATTMAQTTPTGRFEWAKGYTSSEEACHIIGAVTDSVGNLYILGQYNDYAAWDGEVFLYVSDYYPMGTIIAKISPDGDMLWKKVIHTGNGACDQPFDIKPLGDTAFACLVNVEMPSFWFHCYYLDTMIVGWSDYPVPIDPHTVTSTIFTTYLVFDFEGNLLEQHFLQTSYLDTAGNYYYFTYPGTYLPDKLFKFQLMNPTFDLDGEWNNLSHASGLRRSGRLHLGGGRHLHRRSLLGGRSLCGYYYGRQRPSLETGTTGAEVCAPFRHAAGCKVPSPCTTARSISSRGCMTTMRHSAT